MRTALILDHERLTQEQPMFNRLCVGLLAEGVYPVRVVPASFDRAMENFEERRVALMPRISYPVKMLPWLRKQRAARLAEELERLGTQLVHAAGSESWSMAIGVARELERPLVIGVWSLAEVDLARRHRRGGVSAWLAPSERIAAKLRQHVDPELVQVVPAGVPVPARQPAPPSIVSGQSRFLVGLGEGLDVRAWDRFLSAVRRIVDQPGFDDLQIVLEVRGPRGHDVWRKVRDLDLLDRVSSLGDAAEHRTLLLRGHALCLPEPMTMLRTIVLEAMARAIPIAAAAMPVLDGTEGELLVAGEPDESAEHRPATGPWLSRRSSRLTPEVWAAAIRRILGERETIERQCHASWQRVHQCHRSSGQAEGVAALYRALVQGDALPFRT